MLELYKLWWGGRPDLEFDPRPGKINEIIKRIISHVKTAYTLFSIKVGYNYSKATLCSSATLSYVDFMGVIMGELPIVCAMEPSL